MRATSGNPCHLESSLPPSPGFSYTHPIGRRESFQQSWEDESPDPIGGTQRVGSQGNGQVRGMLEASPGPLPGAEMWLSDNTPIFLT